MPSRLRILRVFSASVTTAGWHSRRSSDPEAVCTEGPGAARMSATSGRDQGCGMPLTFCFICTFNELKKRILGSDRRPSYSDCDQCHQPTCRGHGKALSAEQFLCVLCIAAK